MYSFGRGWRRTLAGGLTVLPIEPSSPTPSSSYAVGISMLGRVAGGSGAPFDAPAWREASGAQTYREAGGERYAAYDVSPDTPRRNLSSLIPRRGAGRLHSTVMKALWTALMLVAALINLAPVLGAVLPERMSAMYGVALDDPDLQILMRHRAVLFGIVGGLLLVAAFYPPLRATGYAVGFVSMISFLVVAWLVGDYSARILRVVQIDGVGIAALAGACVVHFFWLRSS